MVLVDDRGWQTKDGVRFVPVSPAERAAGAHVDIRVTLASPTLTATLCAPLNTSTEQVSCWNGTRAVNIVSVEIAPRRWYAPIREGPIAVPGVIITSTSSKID